LLVAALCPAGLRGTSKAGQSKRHAESYFDEHLAQNDYYAAGEIRPGQWIGACAERLGLSNTATREQFHTHSPNRPLTVRNEPTPAFLRA